MKSKPKTGLILNPPLLDSIGRIRRKPTRYRLLEQIMDIEFEKMGVRPHVYHFIDVAPFTAFTIVTDTTNWNWNDISKQIYKCSKRVFRFPYEHASRMLSELKREGIVGVAICDKRDQFNRQRGRIIAKGRLLKHLREEMEE